jgi:phenylacetate-CoA ligase
LEFNFTKDKFSLKTRKRDCEGRNILLIGPLPPPKGGVSIHIQRLSKLITDDFCLDFVDESHQIKDEFFNLRSFRIFNYFKKVLRSDLMYIHSGKRQLVVFHIIVGKVFGKKMILTVHGYPHEKKTFLNTIDSFFYSMAHRIIVVNSFILDRVRLPLNRCVVRNAFVPPDLEDEPHLPGHVVDWVKQKKEEGKLIISANAYQLKFFNSHDLYGLDMCIEAALRLVRKGFPVSFVYNVSSLEKNRDLYDKYSETIIKEKLEDSFLLMNEELSFVRLITFSDIILRPTNTDGDALTIREAMHFGKPVIASDVITRPEGTILFKTRNNDDLESKLVETIAIMDGEPAARAGETIGEYKMFYTGIIQSVLNIPDRNFTSIKDRSKLMTEKIPPAAGVLLNYIPFRIRLGNDYVNFYKLADRMMAADQVTRYRYLVTNFNKVFEHFRKNSPFYNTFLDKAGCTLSRVRDIDDIEAIPLITKSSLRDMPVEKRTVLKHGFKQFNTGGTSGSPLSFFLENNFYSREWSHIHYMWERIGYKPTQTKITIRGKNLTNIYSYRFHQNEFIINSYYSFRKEDYLELLRVFRKYNTEYIHGYPSAIYNFLREVSLNAPFLLDFLKRNIKGIMFGSEFPSPHFRDYIENLITKNTISWYGHTEGVILAGELHEKYNYIPFLSYGYTEAVLRDNHYHLVGTSFDNYAAPFIRYDTEDLINPKFNQYGILESFEITEGRLGEFVTDKGNKKISLTALIFGRHHKLFDKVNFIQVKQVTPGKIVVYYSNYASIDNPAELFDSTNLNIDVVFEQVKEPFKTTYGKIPLLIK